MSKAIDKAAGAEREVTGRKLHARDGDVSHQPSSLRGCENDVYGDLSAAPRVGFVTAPATPDAEQWQGWGTALKPAHEPIVVARKPLGGTVAGNVLEHGTGALNIDGCRIAGTPWNAHRATGLASTKFFTQGDAAEIDKVPHDAGRWPANVVLSHTEDCRLIGEREVRSLGTGASAGSNRSGAEHGTGDDTTFLSQKESRGHYGEDGTETIEAWDCAPGCPVAELDRQSGELTSGRLDPSRITAENHIYGARQKVQEGIYEQDSGGASRFFYCAKASSAERSAGLDGFEEKRPDRDDGRTDGRQWDIPGSLSRPRANVHPTVKPIDLMRWLVRLVTPPGAVVLDPFTGSGTTGIAAVLEGFDFVGIERDEDYARIARARIAWWAEHPEGVQLDEALRADAVRRKVRASGQGSLFESTEAAA